MSSGGNTGSTIVGITTAGVGVGATIAGAGAGVGAGVGSGGLATVPGFAGNEGCNGGVGACAGADEMPDRGVAGVASGAGVPGPGAGDGAAEAAAAFARAWAIRSAVLASCFFLISMRASSCLIFFTKSWMSPGLDKM